MCVHTIVFTRPIRPASHAATGKEKADEHARPEEEQPGLGQRQAEALEQPEREQRLHREAAGEGVDAEQRGEPHDDAARRPERRVPPRRPVGRGSGGIARYASGAGDAEQRVEQEHRPERGELRHAERGERVRAGGGERAGRGGERADQAVAGEDGGAPRVGRRLASAPPAPAARRR